MASGSGYFKVTYGADMAWWGTTFRRGWVVVCAALILVFPLFASQYYLHLANLVAIYAIVALGLNLLTGYTGLVSIGHGGLFAAGAFLAAALQVELNLPFLLVLPTSIVAGAILGLLMGLPALRLRSLYLVLGTLAMHFILVYAGTAFQKTSDAYKWGFTINDATLGPLALNSHIRWYYFLVVLVTLVALFCSNLVRSRVGRAWMAIRDRDVAAEVLGVNVGFYKLLAFMCSGALATMAGTLSAHYTRFVTAEDFTLQLGITFVAMVIIGGLSSNLGSILGAAFVTSLPYLISDALGSIPFMPPAFQTQSASVNLVLFGLFMVLFLIVEPRGLEGIWERMRNYVELWPFRYRRVINSSR